MGKKRDLIKDINVELSIFTFLKYAGSERQKNQDNFSDHAKNFDMNEDAFSLRTNIAVCLVNSKGEIISINSILETLLNLQKENILSHPIYTFLDPRKNKLVRMKISKLNKEKNFDKIQNIFIVPFQCNPLIVDLEFFLIDDRNDKIIAILLLPKDNKYLDELNEKVRFLESNFKKILKNISDIFIELNNKGIIIYISGKTQSLTGYENNELIGKNFIDLLNIPFQKEIKKFISIKQSEDKYISYECEIKNKNKMIIPVIVEGTLINDMQNGIRFVGIIRRKYDNLNEKDEFIKKQKNKLVNIDKIKDDLIRRISHEMKTPLISIYNETEYLLNQYKNQISGDILKFLKDINRGGQRLKNLVDNLLLSYSLEFNELNLTFSKVDLKEILLKTINSLKPILGERKLNLNYYFINNCPIYANESMLFYVFKNIILNAIKNTPENGNILIYINKFKKFVNIIIKDTGIGLTREEKGVLFKKFGKIERERNKIIINREGLGLGLYISKKVIELHGGKIFAVSRGRNRGCLFLIRLYYR
ncbi:MAG: ATP-binding protein [Promethearchaeia archaeon]